MTVEEGARMIISAGLVVPDELPMEDQEREKLIPLPGEVPADETDPAPDQEPARADP